MAQPNLTARLSSLDATFLYYEKKEAPMHIASVSIFDGEVSFKRFIDHLKARLPLLPRYMQKIVPDPLSLSHPAWEFDADFDIQHHVFRHRLCGRNGRNLAAQESAADLGGPDLLARRCAKHDREQCDVQSAHWRGRE